MADPVDVEVLAQPEQDPRIAKVASMLRSSRQQPLVMDWRTSRGSMRATSRLLGSLRIFLWGLGMSEHTNPPMDETPEVVSDPDLMDNMEGDKRVLARARQLGAARTSPGLWSITPPILAWCGWVSHVCHGSVVVANRCGFTKRHAASRALKELRRRRLGGYHHDH